MNVDPPRHSNSGVGSQQEHSIFVSLLPQPVLSAPVKDSASSPETVAHFPSMPGLSGPLLLLVAITVALLALRLWHIRADFPDLRFYSQDHARYTDEGFYTSAALHHFLLGRSYIPGGWNPGVFMPVWPSITGVLFYFTGISVAAARSMAVICTWISVFIAYRVARQYCSLRFALLGTFLVAANALGFFFGRMALLEPAFVMFLLLAIYLAGRVRPGGYGLAAITGLIFTAAILTKTTAPFILPAVLYPMWANNRANRSAAWKLLACCLATTGLLMGFVTWIWLHSYSKDFAMILGLSPSWRMKLVPVRLLRFFWRGTWIDPVLFPLALLGAILGTTAQRSFWRNPLFTTAILWAAGYAAFIAFHIDGPPRYFVVLIVPVVWIALFLTEWLWREHRSLGFAAGICIALSVGWNLFSIGNYIAHPRYTLLQASRGIRQHIATESGPYPDNLLIGRGADEFSLFSGGFPAMDSDGSMPLAQKLQVYRPGWFSVWSRDVPLRKLTVAESRRLVKRGEYHALDSRTNATVTLYRLLPYNSDRKDSDFHK